MLPGLESSEEDAFISTWMESDDIEGLVALISEAISVRRPRLAARLFGLLDDSVEIPSEGPLARAKQAAQFLLVQPQAVERFDAFEQAWIEARRDRIRKIKKRMRNRLMGRPPRRKR